MEQTDQQLGLLSERLSTLAGHVSVLTERISVLTERVSILTDTQSEFIGTMLGHVESQRESNAEHRRGMKELAQSTRQELNALAQAQRGTEQKLSDLIEIVGGLARTVYKNGSPPQG